jgi:hypothetical protein
MVEVVLALAAIAVTAAIVIGDARPPTPQEPPPREPGFEELPVLPTPLLLEQIDAPTEAMDLAALSSADAPALAQTTFALPLPSARTLPLMPEPSVGTPHPRPDPDRLIQTEVQVPDGGGEHAKAVTRLVIGITASGLVLGLMLMGLGRAIGLLFR